MTSVRVSIMNAMADYMSPMLAETIAGGLPPAANREVGTLDVVVLAELMQWLDARMKLFARNVPASALDELRRVLTAGRSVPAAVEKLEILSEADVLASQRACRGMVKHFFGTTDAVRLVTVVSELSRNIYMYAKRGSLELSLGDESGRFVLRVEARDQGPGIRDVDAVLRGTFVSKTGLGRGLRGAQAIFDTFQVETSRSGTTVRGSKRARRVA